MQGQLHRRYEQATLHRLRDSCSSVCSDWVGGWTGESIPHDASEEIAKPPAEEEREIIVSWIVNEILGETVRDEKDNDLSPEEDSSPDQNDSSEEKPMAEEENDLDSYLKLLQEIWHCT